MTYWDKDTLDRARQIDRNWDKDTLDRHRQIDRNWEKDN